MKVYTVINSSSMTLGVFSSAALARKFVKTVGKKLWNENWTIESHKLDDMDRMIDLYNTYEKPFKKVKG